MEEKELIISKSSKLTSSSWAGVTPASVELEYIEHATDHYSGDRTTYIDISKEKAIEIIAFLENSFDITPNPAPTREN